MKSKLFILIQRIVGGKDKEAEEEFFTLISDQLRAIIRIQLYKLVDRAISTQAKEDILSKVREILLEKIRAGKYDETKGEPGSYATGITRNVIREYIRKRPLEEPQSSFSEGTPENQATVLNNILTQESERKLKKCLNKLKPKYQKILILSFIEERSNQEIAKLLKIDQQRVRERIHYALKLLREICRKNKFFSTFSLFLLIYLCCYQFLNFRELSWNVN